MTKQDYFNKLSRIFEKGSFEDFCELSKQKPNFIPKKLYKYSWLSNYTIENLENRQMYLSIPDEFNDPFDTFEIGTSMKEQMPKGLEEMFGFSESAIVNSKLKEKLPDIIHYGYNSENFGEILGLRNGIGVCCFTENSPDNIIMWSHYANQHRGICLEYDFSQREDIFQRLHPILYRNHYIDMELSSHSRYSRDGFMFAMIQTHLTKSKEWEYEMEWRFLEHIQEEGRFADTVVHPTHIYLGLNSNNLPEEEQQVYISRLKEFSKDNDIPVSLMERCKNVYKLYPILTTN